MKNRIEKSNNILKTKEELRQACYYLYDKGEKSEKWLLYLLRELAEYMMISEESFKQIFESAKRRYENET